MKNRYLYHLVDKNELQSVLTYGLFPRIGKNSLASKETEPRIYATPYSSVPFWKIALSRNIVLRIDMSCVEEKPEVRDHILYKEVLFRSPIPPDALKKVYTPKPTLEQAQWIQ